MLVSGKLIQLKIRITSPFDELHIAYCLKKAFASRGYQSAVSALSLNSEKKPISLMETIEKELRRTHIRETLAKKNHCVDLIMLFLLSYYWVS